ncbi:UbiH/UbiF family hydroxylase [Sagittula salina]|uniref:UbiH/UbiF family hydroxylase n=1 Tax=Sagittula salina TaxID=2820268 RepID=A0A940RYN8_9RHOB|nr:UbiH/UbiF family hydroxylase [Sagittula salina]MBP0481083.1 UbiH/UbiF family hydroxylase [Sagittula salina]
MDYDITISGGGIAGLTAAAAFAQAGFRTLVVDPAPPVTEREAEGSDLRSTAFLQPAQSFLEEVGLWPRLAEYAMPLQTMRIVDAGGETAEARAVKDFAASEISDKPFGWNLPNWLLRREMATRLGELAQVDFRPGTATTGLFTREGEARVSLSDGSRVTTRLVIAADGRNSPMRQAAGIRVKTTRFGQKALAFAVTHAIPHNNVSTEIHRTGGPFTLVPLPDHQGRPSSAVVWMDAGPEQARRMALSPEAFEAEMSERSCHLFGPLALASRRTLWPIIAQEAERLTGQRLALVAEAAHVVPPIGAQGLNMSLKDMAVLRDLALDAPDRLGDAGMLDAYHRRRVTDIRARVAGITALNRVSQMSAHPLRDMRAKGLDMLYSLKPVRASLMKLGLGASD